MMSIPNTPSAISSKSKIKNKLYIRPEFFVVTTLASSFSLIFLLCFNEANEDSLLRDDQQIVQNYHLEKEIRGINCQDYNRAVTVEAETGKMYVCALITVDYAVRDWRWVSVVAPKRNK